MKKKICFSVLILVVLGLLTATGIGVYYLQSTISANGLEKHAVSLSQRGEQQSFSYLKQENATGDSEYIFLVAGGHNKNVGQELFIYRKNNLFPSKFPRYTLFSKPKADEPYLAASISVFSLRNQEGELEATNIMVLHSANEEKISRITWTMNKQGVMTTEERQVSPEQPFVVVIPALEKKGNTNKPSVLVTFLNDKGKVVQTANA